MIAAIVPACGRSTRMGRPKLLIEFAGVPLIRHVITALSDGGVQPVVVVAPAASEASAREIHQLVCAAGAKLCIPEPRPDDMRGSFEAGVDWLGSHLRQAPEAVFLAPGDSPGLGAPLVQQMIAFFYEHSCDFLVPTFEGIRGHPLLMAWRQAKRVSSLSPDTGVNHLLRQPDYTTVELAIDDPAILIDIDTPEDLTRWNAL